jgi:hypothetical protein
LYSRLVAAVKAQFVSGLEPLDAVRFTALVAFGLDVLLHDFSLVVCVREFPNIGVELNCNFYYTYIIVYFITFVNVFHGQLSDRDLY